MAKLEYDYTTKNFHRYKSASAGAVPNEIYVPKAAMTLPKAHIEVEAKLDVTGELVQTRSKPAKG